MLCYARQPRVINETRFGDAFGGIKLVGAVAMAEAGESGSRAADDARWRLFVSSVGASTCVRCSVTRGRLQRAGRLAWVLEQGSWKQTISLSVVGRLGKVGSTGWVHTDVDAWFFSAKLRRRYLPGSVASFCTSHAARLDSPQAEILDQIVPSPRLSPLR